MNVAALPSWAFDIGASGLALAALALAVWSVLPVAYARLAGTGAMLAFAAAAYLTGAADANAACEAASLRRQLEDAQSDNGALRRRIETVEAARRDDAARFAAGAAEDRSNQGKIDATPSNGSACLDRDAADRIRGVR
ncbi:Uncharacterised protein [Starkeya nomas]|uniref:Uncharacterized protein n=1 Tax=Starkeya nomas TaxID=2666134 RepID=A0A5S9R589_9HYPH|nr:hypothetical protein [Starkeya nomas]CAA0130489.1 Uncharacterised protein [Starkeya nomas]